VAFQIRPRQVWFGDGTALIEKTWQAESVQRVASSIKRAEEYFGLKGKAKAVVGARPYVEDHKAGYFAQVGDRTWVSTGGAKNGTLLAAEQAAQFIEEAKL
jgi:hypothetical protein